MSYNVSVSHRGFNIKCKWWSRINNSFDFNKSPNGFFYCKELSEKEAQRDFFMGNSMIMMERDTVIIKTPDDLSGIKTDDAVEFDDEKWFVVDFRRKRIRIAQNEFTNKNNTNYYWVLSLRK